MCGLFGIVGRGITKDDVGIFKDLAVFSSVRGIDATGFAILSTYNAKMELSKKINDPIWFLRNIDKDTTKALENLSNNVYLGHTRWATTGTQTKEAAQPFAVGNIVGTHNGTLVDDRTGFYSDSHQLFSRINEIGVKNTIRALLPADSYALVWYDRSTKKVNFLRNSKRSLWFAVNKKRDTLYYASEPLLISAACWRHGAEIEKLLYCEEDTMYTFDPINVKKGDSPSYHTTNIPQILKEIASEAPFFTGSEAHKGPNVDV